MESKRIARSLAALAQDRRLASYRRRVETGPAGEIDEAPGLPDATRAFHLKALTDTGPAVARPEGRFVCYRASFGRLHTAPGDPSANCSGGANCPPSPAPAGSRRPAFPSTD